MKTPLLAVAGLTCLALAGCRTDPSITLLERQNRMLEDEVYRLRGVIQDFEEGGAPVNCREGVEGAPVQGEMWKSRESAESAGESYAPRGRKSTSSQPLPGPIVTPGEAQPPGEIPDTFKRPVGTPAPVQPGKLNAPQAPMQLDGPSGPGLPGSQSGQRTGAGRTSRIEPARDYQSVAQDDSGQVAQLVLNRMLTGGYSAGGRSGDSGLRVVIEPRDAKGRRLEAPGDVAVVLVDPSKTGREAKLARWDFPATETAKLFRGNGIARGMYVECPWPEGPPDNNSLHLYVRYTTRDGRKLETDQYVEVALGGEKAARWTPAETEQRQATASGREVTAYQQIGAEGSESEAADSPGDDSPPPRRAGAMRTVTRSNSPATQRPVWSPQRF